MEGKKRTYYLFVPASVKPDKPAPLVVLLHGSRRDGFSLADRWRGLAKKEGVIVVAPDAADLALWTTPVDGPDFLYALVESIKTKHSIDARRVYLFGHSNGAGFAMIMSMLASEYFAATAVHAGALSPNADSLIRRATRKIPVSIQVGDRDPYFPPGTVRSTRDMLRSRGFAVELTELPGHDHWYYDRAAYINQKAWEFLRGHALTAEPRFEPNLLGAGGTEAEKSRCARMAYNRGVERQQAGNLKAAITAYSRAIRCDPAFVGAYNNRGVARLMREEYAQAVEDFTTVIRLEPTAAAYNNRAGAYASLKRRKEAIADFTRAIEIKPAAGSHFSRGIAYAEDGDFDSAYTDYTSAIGLDPKLARAYLNRGIISASRGKVDEAADDFAMAFRLDPGLRAELNAYMERFKATKRSGG